VAYSRYLAHGERIVTMVRRHPLVLIRPFFIAVGAIFGAILLGALLSPNQSADIFDTVLSIVALFFLFRFGWAVWEWRVDKIIVTDRRLLEVSGLLTRKVASMPLEKMTDLTYSRSIGGRLFGYGRIGVESAGQDQALTTIDFLPTPDDFYRTVTALVAGVMARPDPETVHEASWDDDDTGPLPRVIV
jgi:uncharacterized membrane protein YdbT with pleckstrin-like domain